MQLAPGDVFAGYTVVEALGAGGMGEVYLARHPRLPRRDALKVLPAAVSQDSTFRERFTREADLASGLWHPNVFSVYDRGEHGGQLWIAMEFVDGTDAGRQLVASPAGLPVGDMMAIATAVAAALDHAHSRGLLHRDVKPANIMLARNDASGAEGRRILLADFGIARPLDEVSGLTTTNMTVGTVAYAAPEQLMGEQIDGRADQYSLAATAYHLLSGEQLFPQSNPAVVISRHLNADPPSLADRRPELAGLDPVLARALSKEPADRYTRCAELARALSAAVSTDARAGASPTAAAPIGPKRDAGHLSAHVAAAGTGSLRRWPQVGFLAATVVVLILGLAVWRLWASSQTAAPSVPSTSTSMASPPAVTSSSSPSVATAPLPPPASTTTTPPAPDTSYALPACYDAQNLITVEPETPNLFCRQHFYEDLKWTKWTSSSADGSGIQQLQNCDPNCASGEVFRNPVEVHFTGAAAPPANSNCPTGLRYYTQLIAAYPSGPAPDVGASVNVTPTRYNGMPALRWNNLQPYCLTY
ncbi:serine/threonine-protein kinase [Mycobacterium sp. URHB0021]